MSLGMSGGWWSIRAPRSPQGGIWELFRRDSGGAVRAVTEDVEGQKETSPRRVLRGDTVRGGAVSKMTPRYGYPQRESQGGVKVIAAGKDARKGRGSEMRAVAGKGTHPAGQAGVR